MGASFFGVACGYAACYLSVVCYLNVSAKQARVAGEPGDSITQIESAVTPERRGQERTRNDGCPLLRGRYLDARLRDLHKTCNAGILNA